MKGVIYMIGFLAFIAGLSLGLLVAIFFAGWCITDLFSGQLSNAEGTMLRCNELLESIENHTIEIKTESE
jgi:hypothetical protein